MAYVSQEKKKKISDAIKALKLPKAWKWTLKVNHHTELVLTIRQAPATVFDDYIGHIEAERRGMVEGKNSLESFIEDGSIGINIFHLDKSWTGPTLKVLQKMLDAIKTGGEWFDKSDAMTDYFHTAFYIDMRFGAWDKACTFVGNRRTKSETVKAVAEERDIPVVDVKMSGVSGGDMVGVVDLSAVPAPLEAAGDNVVHVAFPQTPSREMQREIAQAELVRRSVVRMKATHAGATLNDAALVALAEAALAAVTE